MLRLVQVDAHNAVELWQVWLHVLQLERKILAQAVFHQMSVQTTMPGVTQTTYVDVGTLSIKHLTAFAVSETQSVP
jgi:hypothetical protein